jgi:cyclic pyranopterin phosphate synthase
MPEDGVAPCSHGEIARYEDIMWLSRVLVSLGVTRVRFTGGEPFARLGMAEFLASFRREFPSLHIAVTTNASLLEGHGAALAEARLSGMNISLDTLDSRKFAEITRTGNISDVTRGIESALSLGIPLKTNTVLMRGVNDSELPAILRFAWARGITPRVIEFMPLEGSLWGSDKFIGSAEILELAGKCGKWTPAPGGGVPGGPAKYYTDTESGNVLGIIEAVSNHFCAGCNRLRITASAKMRACLFNNEEIPLLDAIRERDEDSVRRAILSGIGLKPENWRECADGRGHMSDIGG